MNSFWQGKICPVCDREFTQDDDVVFCPECGTAHHRECWNLRKACYFADEHAKGNFDTANKTAVVEENAIVPDVQTETSDNFDTDEGGLKICPCCGAKNNPLFRICVNCGHEFQSGRAEYEKASAYPPPPDASAGDGSVPHDYEQRMLNDDISYADMSRYYGKSSENVMQRIQKAADGKPTFCVGAFFFSFFWLLYHKVVGVGIAIALAVSSPVLFLSGMFYNSCAEQLNSLEYISQQQYASSQLDIFADFLENNAHIATACAEIFWILFALSMFLCGFFGTRIYFNTAVKNIRIIKQRAFDRYQREYYYSIRGGVSLLMPLLGIISVSLASSIISYFSIFFA